MIKSPLSQLISGCLLFLVLISTVWLYWQGLPGAFIFDDFSNLKDLSTIKDAEQFNETWRFITEGIAGSLGRPVSLITFVWQADSWPFYPGDFKYINLMIHLLNGCLIFWFILIITRILKLSEKQSLLLALLTTSIWLWHPLQVSTVLYVIQRMTQLVTLFTLAGLLTYLYGRQHLAKNRLKIGFFWVSIGVGLGGILATLSKESGILLVLYIIVLEFTLLQSLPKPRYWKLWSGIFLYSPLILLSIFFTINFGNILQGYEIREFTMGERLLTQARVLVDYLTKILLLSPHGFTLFHDDFPISRSLIEPFTTLLSIVFIGITFISAIILRHKKPILAFGILFFLAGHVLESSFVGLMLYFEHRNYLPMLGIIFATLYIFINIFEYLVSPFLRKITFSVSLLLLSLFPLITWSQTDLWGKPLFQAAFWANQHPKSLGAQSHAFTDFYNMRKYRKADEYVWTMQDNFPEYTAPYLYKITSACATTKVELLNMPKIIKHLKTSKYDYATLSVLDSLLKQRSHCKFLDFDVMDELFKALIHNQNHAFYKPYFYVRYANFQASEKYYGSAIETGKQALALKGSIYLRVKITKWLMTDKRFDEAAVFLQETLEKLNPLEARFHYKGLKLLEAKISMMQELHKTNFQINN